MPADPLLIAFVNRYAYVPSPLSVMLVAGTVVPGQFSVLAVDVVLAGMKLCQKEFEPLAAGASCSWANRQVMPGAVTVAATGPMPLTPLP